MDGSIDAKRVTRERSSGRPDERFPGLTVVRQFAGVDGVLVSVVATVNLTRRTGRINFIHPVANVSPTSIDRTSQVIVRPRGTDGAALDEFPVPVRLDSELVPGQDQTGLVDSVLPIDAAATAVELVIDGRGADTFRVGQAPPVARAIQAVSTEGQALRVAIEFDRALERGQTYAVQVTSDHGETWQTVGVGLRQQPFALDRSQFQEGQEVQLRVITTNGLSATVVTSEPYRISEPKAGAG